MTNKSLALIAMALFTLGLLAGCNSEPQGQTIGGSTKSGADGGNTGGKAKGGGKVAGPEFRP